MPSNDAVGLRVSYALLAEAVRRYPPSDAGDHKLYLNEDKELTIELAVDGEEYVVEIGEENLDKSPKEILDEIEQKEEALATYRAAREVDETTVYEASSVEGEDEYGRHLTVTVGPAAQRFRWVKPGKFMMGSPSTEAGRDSDERLHEVTLTQGYWLGETAISQAFWKAVMRTVPSEYVGMDRPVETVSWHDAVKFAGRMNELLPGGWRLPTEAEWENACRAGTSTATWAGDLDQPHGKSKVLDPIAWYYGNRPEGEDGTQPVGTKLPNPWGFKDMLGNVWEWCSDLFGDYPSGPVSDPSGYGSDSAGRVVRGGSWSGDPGGVRAAFRYGHSPGNRDGLLGFRLARGPQV